MVGLPEGPSTSELNIRTTWLPWDDDYKNSEDLDIYLRTYMYFQIAWWIYVVSALGGVILLAIITGILIKCGFFKRAGTPEDVVDATEKDGGADEEEGNECEKGENDELDAEELLTPITPMLQGTEIANDDFDFQRPGNKSDIP
ncbi:hypothetical protein SK128_009672 [Halocaridina rubra]|uniref:Uncharacterized protein n=1 Tax=Halocaridina rubra TaxID=373956 RepID=A0AAN9A2W2_HALRR